MSVTPTDGTTAVNAGNHGSMTTPSVNMPKKAQRIIHNARTSLLCDIHGPGSDGIMGRHRFNPFQGIEASASALSVSGLILQVMNKSQTPPHLVVKFQGIDIVDVIL
jgi:hypothetical protein